MTDFNATKYETGDTFFADGSDAYANKGMVLGFHHIPSGRELYFKAAITAFNESYNSDWTSEIVYGRADAIMLFKNTERRISLAFNIAASSKSEAYENLAKVGDLAKFLYPYYTDISDATTIGQSPLVRLKVMNLLSTQKDAGSGQPYGGLDTLSSQSGDADRGLLGAITNISINHNLENGDAGSIEAAFGVVLPKLIEINLEFNVIHEHAIGWSESGFGGVGGDVSGESFPYGLNSTDSTIVGQLTAPPVYVPVVVNSVDDGGDSIEGDQAELPGLDEEGLTDGAAVNAEAASATTAADLGITGTTIDAGLSEVHAELLSAAFATDE
jgi:hypothetical protein